MKAFEKQARSDRWLSACVFIGLIFLAIGADARSRSVSRDSSISDQIRLQLLSNRQGLPLYFPATVKRFYAGKNYQPAWLLKQNGADGYTWQAMLLLDCVLQYGLSHADYHPVELQYGLLHDIFDEPGKVGMDRQARFDIFLTDAMLTIISHLHYGKLNPELNNARIDAGKGDLDLKSVLAKATTQPHLMDMILDVQPRSEAYMAMQQWMHKWKGQFLDDCYEVPEATVRKVAINMERLRWAAIGEGPYIQINIPSFTLSVFLKDSTYRFKVVTGAAKTPTPVFQSAIYSITEAPKLQMPDRSGANEVVAKVRSKQRAREGTLNFYFFPNRLGIAITELRAPAWFKTPQRAITNGNIGIEAAPRLAALLLKEQGTYDRSSLIRKTRAFPLAKPIPLKVTYLTCLIKDGQVMNYGDVYQLDARLEKALYYTVQTQP